MRQAWLLSGEHDIVGVRLKDEVHKVADLADIHLQLFCQYGPRLARRYPEKGQEFRVSRGGSRTSHRLIFEPRQRAR